MSKKPLRIGILSFAHMHAYSYAACLNALHGVTFSAVWDDVPKRGRAAAKDFDTKFILDQTDFLESGLDGVIVCSENIHHRKQVEAAARAGVAVLCEKPLATTVSDAEAMIRACESAGVQLGTAFPCRFVTALSDTRDRMRRGDVGKLLAAACTNNGQFPGGWFADPKLSGGGAVMDHTVHVADVLRWITGREFTRVYCVATDRLHPEVPTDSAGSLQLEMDDGVIVSHVASWNRPKSFPTWGDVTLELVGANGMLDVDAFKQKVDVYDDGTNRADWAFCGDNPDLALVKDFADAIRENRPPRASGLDGLRAVEVTEAAHRSLKSGKFEKI